MTGNMLHEKAEKKKNVCFRNVYRIQDPIISQKDIVKETRKSWFIMNNLLKHIELYTQDYDYIGKPSNS